MIEDSGFIGYGSIILIGAMVGHDSLVGSGSVVTNGVPPGSVGGGNPPRIICTPARVLKKGVLNLLICSPKTI